METLRARRGTGPDGAAPAPEGASAPSSSADLERWLRCAACGARVVPERARLAVKGSHEHRFMNPSGIHYVVGCWSVAPGCASAGERSSVWTWFPGFAWQIEVCRACAAHLGWSFHAATSFYALIGERLA